jgi:hypothetical protein
MWTGVPSNDDHCWRGHHFSVNNPVSPGLILLIIVQHESHVQRDAAYVEIKEIKALERL